MEHDLNGNPRLRDHLPSHKLEMIHLPETDLDEGDDAKANAIASALTATSREVRNLVRKLRDSIPIFTEEGSYANVGDTHITLAPYSPNLILVKTVMYQGAAGASSWTLQLGMRKFKTLSPSTGGYLNDLNIVLKPEDLRQLTWVGGNVAGDGDVFLEITGHQLPEVSA